MSTRSFLRAAVFILLLFSTPSVAAAQSGVTLSGGLAWWDLSGTGAGTMIALRWDAAVARMAHGRSLAIEAGAGWFQDGQTGQGAVDLLIPEVGVRLGLLGPLALGAGAGWAVGLEDRTGDDLTLWTALSVDLQVGPDWSLRPEVRLRSVDPWVGTIADVTVGIRRSFRRGG